MSDCEGSILTINIKNFPEGDRAACPYCGEKPEEIEWSPEGLRIWCRNKECSGDHYKLFREIAPEEWDLIKVTRQLLYDWSQYGESINRKSDM